MTRRQGKSGTIDVKALVSADEEFLRALVRTALQEVLEAEMTEVLGAEKGDTRGTAPPAPPKGTASASSSATARTDRGKC